MNIAPLEVAAAWDLWSFLQAAGRRLAGLVFAAMFCFVFYNIFLALTLYWFMVAMRKEKEMAVAAMAWVEGIPYSASVRTSSFTTGGERGRGHFRMSLETCPMYITIWGEETPQAVSLHREFPPCPPQNHGYLSFSAAKSTAPRAELIL